MKLLRMVIILVCLSYFSMTCNKQDHDEADHQHSAQEANDHDQEAADHDHEAPDSDHDHEHAEDTDHDTDEIHEHAEDEHQAQHEAGIEHSHEAETDEEHTHAADEPHEHAIDDESTTHQHTADDLITVEGNWETLVGLETAVVHRMSVERMITVPGKIVPNQNQVADVSALIEGSINCVLADLGDRIGVDDELVCITSPEIGMLRAEYDKTKAELEIRRQNFQRKQNLYKESIISERAYQEAELALHIADVNYNYAMKKLLAVGITVNELDHPPEGHSIAVGSTMHIHAPIAGVITSRNARTGQKVGSNTVMFEIMDLSTVWCEADIFEKDLKNVKMGQRIRLQVSAYPDQSFNGRIFYISSTLNDITKTMKILIEIDNRNEMLKPGMFADTHIVMGKKENILAVPREAILMDEHIPIVFLKEPGGYHRHIVETGIVSDIYTEIVSGISDGAIVVTKGNYQLKSKIKMSGVDPHAGHVH